MTGQWTATDEVLRAWAYLSRVAEPPRAALAQWVAVVGPVDAAAAIRDGAAPPEVAPHVQARRETDCAAQDLDLLFRRGGRLITPEDAEWPHLAFVGFGSQSLRGKAEGHAPLVLWAMGPARLDEVVTRSTAIVGTRAATAYGEHMAGDFAAGLAEHDVAVVSGGAYGIDGAAHRASLAADGTTVAVLAGGIDIPYPAGHSALLHRIAANGLLVSEYPPGVRPARFRFLTRNRLVAALSGVTVVVEAGLRSGAASTAAWADALGRVVCAVPGPVTSSASAGCHALIRRGAQLVTGVDEVVELAGRPGELAVEPDHPSSPLDVLSDAERRVYEALPARGLRGVDQLSVTAGIAPAQLLAPLAMLELAGLVEKCDGRWRLAKPGGG